MTRNELAKIHAKLVSYAWQMALKVRAGEILTREDAEDIVENVYKDIFGRPSILKSLNVATVLLLVRNRVRLEIAAKSKGRFQREFETHKRDSELEERRATEQMKQIERILNTLPIEHAEVFRMRFYEQLTFREIAERMSLPAGAVVARIHRTFKKIRKELDKDTAHNVAPAETLARNQTSQPEPAILSLIVDAETAPAVIAEFLAELSALYSALSGGDALIIRDGRMPVHTGVPR